jgi:hypothetical protein
MFETTRLNIEHSCFRCYYMYNTVYTAAGGGARPGGSQTEHCAEPRIDGGVAPWTAVAASSGKASAVQHAPEGAVGYTGPGGACDAARA